MADFLETRQQCADGNEMKFVTSGIGQVACFHPLVNCIQNFVLLGFVTQCGGDGGFCKCPHEPRVISSPGRLVTCFCQRGIKRNGNLVMFSLHDSERA